MGKYEGLREAGPAPLRAAGVVVIEGKKSRSSNKQKQRKKPINRSGDWYRKYMEV